MGGAEQPGAAIDRNRQPGAAKRSQWQPAAARRNQEQADAPRRGQKHAGKAKSSQNQAQVCYFLWVRYIHQTPLDRMLYSSFGDLPKCSGGYRKFLQFIRFSVDLPTESVSEWNSKIGEEQ